MQQRSKKSYEVHIKIIQLEIKAWKHDAHIPEIPPGKPKGKWQFGLQGKK